MWSPRSTSPPSATNSKTAWRWPKSTLRKWRVKVASPEIAAPDNRAAEQQPHWRQEFPIDTPQDDYRSRRDFTKLMVITSFAFFVGQAWIVLLSRLRRARGEAPVKDIAGVDELPVGGAKLFHYPSPGDASLLVRVSEGQFVAYGQIGRASCRERV